MNRCCIILAIVLSLVCGCGRSSVFVEFVTPDGKYYAVDNVTKLKDGTQLITLHQSLIGQRDGAELKP